MIVKNEEANLGPCLESVADLVNEIIIVDTGSTDRTKEIALIGQRHFSKWASCESGDGGVAFLEHRRCANKLAQGRAQRRPGF